MLQRIKNNPTKKYVQILQYILKKFHSVDLQLNGISFCVSTKDYSEVLSINGKAIFVDNVELKDRILEITIRHHEKIDGTGYYRKLKGEDLIRTERILTIADIVSALCGNRSYKDVFDQEKNRNLLKKIWIWGSYVLMWWKQFLSILKPSWKM